jgi:hypothetical protein
MKAVSMDDLVPPRSAWANKTTAPKPRANINYLADTTDTAAETYVPKPTDPIPFGPIEPPTHANWTQFAQKHHSPEKPSTPSSEFENNASGSAVQDQKATPSTPQSSINNWRRRKYAAVIQKY